MKLKMFSWGLGIGPNPQSPIPIEQDEILFLIKLNYIIKLI